MSRFNTASEPTKITNFAGGEAYSQDANLEFVSILLTSFVQDQYYRKSDDMLARLKELLNTVDPKFAAKAALYARNTFNMRSISHVVAGELACRVKGADWTRSFFDKIISRPDDLTEILSYYYAQGNKNEPNAMKRGFADALQRFDEYQLAKYKSEGKDVSLVDIVNLVHPNHTLAIGRLVDGSLPTANTWESGLVKAGQNAKSDEEKQIMKADTWRQLLREHKLGYFALLRNLRNIIEQAPDMLNVALTQLQDEDAIRKSKVLPFRFFSAYKELLNLNGSEYRSALSAISNALDIAIDNMPVFERSLIVVDHSGSMDSNMSQRSDATMFEIGALFGVAMAKKSNADFMYFGDIARYCNISQDSTLGQLRWLQQCNGGANYWGGGHSGTNVGHGTNFNAVFEEANQAYDRIFLFSDMQAWVGYHVPKDAFNQYKQRTGANPSIYAFDLSGYGSMQFPEPQAYQLAGFSDKILDVIKLLEEDKNAMVGEIEKIEL